MITKSDERKIREVVRTALREALGAYCSVDHPAALVYSMAARWELSRRCIVERLAAIEYTNAAG